MASSHMLKPDLPMYYRVVLAALIVATPFNGLPMPRVAGELSSEGPFYVSLALIAPYMLRIGLGRARVSVLVALGAATLLFALLLSLVANAQTIETSVYGGRSGMVKFVNSVTTFIYFWIFCGAIVDLAARYGVNRILQVMSRAAVIIAAILVLEYAFEVATWYSPALHSLLAKIAPIWNFNAFVGAYDARLRGFSFEPSFQSLSAVGIGLLVGWRVWGPDRGRRWTALLLAAFIGFQFLSGSRTFYVCFLTMLVALGVLVLGRRLPGNGLKALLILAVPHLAQAAAIRNLVHGSLSMASTSNITRSSSIYTAFQMFLDHPLFGIGLGQFSLRYINYVPSWALQSWEVRRFLSSEGLSHPNVMPSYNLYARLAGETGLLGFLAWLIFELTLLSGLLRYSQIMAKPSRSNLDARATIPMLVAGLAGYAAGGTSLDSVRLYYLWIFAGLAAVVLETRWRRRPVPTADTIPQRQALLADT